MSHGEFRPCVCTEGLRNRPRPLIRRRGRISINA